MVKMGERESSEVNTDFRTPSKSWGLFFLPFFPSLVHTLPLMKLRVDMLLENTLQN